MIEISSAPGFAAPARYLMRKVVFFQIFIFHSIQSLNATETIGNPFDRLFLKNDNATLEFDFMGSVFKFLQNSPDEEADRMNKMKVLQNISENGKSPLIITKRIYASKIKRDAKRIEQMQREAPYFLGAVAIITRRSAINSTWLLGRKKLSQKKLLEVLVNWDLEHIFHWPKIL